MVASDGIGLVLGLALVLIGLFVLVAARRVRLRNMKGNVIVGDVGGSVTQSYKSGPPPASTPAAIGAKELIGWVLAVPGALLAAWTLVKAVGG